MRLCICTARLTSPGQTSRWPRDIFHPGSRSASSVSPTDTLDHFILERPRGVAGEDCDEFGQDDYRREQTRPGIMPGAQDYSTIGHRYEIIRRNLVDLDRKLGGDRLFLGDAAGQIDKNTTDLKGIEPIGNLDGELAAIDIIKQGEGSPADREDSHYYSFLAIRDELETLMREPPTFTPPWSVANSQPLRQPSETEDKVFIDNPEAAEIIDFACATYGFLLRCLGQCFGYPGDEGSKAK